MKMFYNHPYHLVTFSPWPLLTSMNMMFLLLSIIMMFNYKNYFFLYINFINILLCSYQWWRDIIRESTFQGLHSLMILNSLKIGMILFIISELLFFISFFWSYFHSALSPNIEIGSIWPPKNIIQFNPYMIPSLNTIILLSSGCTITWCHYSILNNKKLQSMLSLFTTIFLGLIFTMIQFFEYNESMFCMNDSIYGSLFFMTTGFHGLHVIIGSIFLSIILIRIINKHISMIHHFGFEASSWYWHFVDVIWIIVFSMIYWWNY
uniref:Cytochrome c oxidase subunit 3 n=1 Tax=Paramblynotus sp. ZJUH 20220012 TaxID=2943458 RepID=A0A9E8G733_9HYME|nr:cytochrome c oxidase subunit 3 [Paramblynotus sp. ZJUH 20220012]